MLALTPPSADPNWLLSTAAQSAAALVAIIGGLLATRLLGLASDREQLLRQAADLDAQLKPLQKRRDHLRGSTRSLALETFRDHYLSVYARNKGVLPTDDESFHPRGATKDDLSEWHADVSSSMLALFDRIEQVLTPGTRRLGRADLISRGIGPPEFADDLLDAVLAEIERRRPKSPYDVVMSGLDPGLLGAIVPGFVHARRDAELTELAQLDARLAELHAKTELNAGFLLRVQRPPGVRWNLFALAAFALLGIGLPLTLMAVRPVPSGALTRAGVLVAFGLGLALVISSIAYQAFQLQQGPEPSSGVAND